MAGVLHFTNLFELHLLAAFSPFELGHVFFSLETSFLDLFLFALLPDLPHFRLMPCEFSSDLLD